MLQHKSAANVGPEQQQQQQQQQQQKQRLASSRSETCITELIDLDYDELPEEDRLPVLPPKTKPLLPPKQKINKSQDDLARIEYQLRTSISQLQTPQPRDADYDDLPEEDADSHAKKSSQRKSKGEVKLSGTAQHQQLEPHEFEDYDDPVVHVVVDEYEDYDEPPDRQVKKV